jgi:CBS domain-containing protein
LRDVDPQSTLAALIPRPALTVPASCTLVDAVERMEAAGVSALVVGDHRGIVTERDLARALAAGRALDEPVERAATRQPVAVPGATTVVAAAGLMLNEHVRHLLVELDDGTVGVVSVRDVLAVLLQATDPDPWLTSLRAAIETPSEIWLG